MLRSYGFSAILAALLCVACRDEGAPHVFHAPAPAPPPAAAGPDVVVPDVAFGATGPAARITSIVDASTGAPVALNDILDSTTVTALFARGPQRDQAAPVDVRLVLSGACVGAESAHFRAPAPALIAHQFRLVAGSPAVTCSRSGTTLAQVELMTPNRRVLVSSIPLRLVFRYPR